MLHFEPIPKIHSTFGLGIDGVSVDYIFYGGSAGHTAAVMKHPRPEPYQRGVKIIQVPAVSNDQGPTAFKPKDSGENRTCLRLTPLQKPTALPCQR